MNALSIFKTVAELAIATGVSSIVSNASKAAVPENARLIKKISIGIGTFVLSNMVADQAVKYTQDKIDKGLEEIEKTKAAIADAKEQQEKETS
jgi:prefoldin subunit 5